MPHDDEVFPNENMPALLIDRLLIGNMKSFQGQHCVRLAPLTLIYGPNAAGKSTVLQSLQLLAQSVLIDRFDPSSTFVDVGDFERVINGHDASKVLTLGLDLNYEIGDPVTVLGRDGEIALRPGVRGTNGFKIAYSCEGRDQHPISEVAVWGPNTPPLAAPAEPESVSEEVEQDGETLELGPFILRWKMDLDGAESVSSMIDLLQSLQDFPRRPDREVELLRYTERLIAAGFVSSVSLEFWHDVDDVDFREGFQLPQQLALHISPNELADMSGLASVSSNELFSNDLRAVESMINNWSNGTHDSVRFQGFKSLSEMFLGFEKRVHELFSSQLTVLGPSRPAPKQVYLTSESALDQSVELVRRLDRQPGMLGRVNDWLGKLGVPYTLDIDKLVSSRSREDFGYSLDLIDARSEVHVSLSDVGYGVSQLLPIVVECVGSTEKTICIEQPELHLHPRLQSNLGDLFGEALRAGNQIIAETHSENILLRVRNLIRKGVLTPEDVSVVYIDNNPESHGSVVHHLRLGDSGELLDAWPTGFFDDKLRDVLGV